LQPVRHFPLAGVARDYLAEGLRVTFHGSYAIYYGVAPDAVIVIRVIHGARDVTKLIAPDDFP
jgi:plasmid stabilization system protein ParE